MAGITPALGGCERDLEEVGMRGIRSAGICLVALVVASAVTASPAAAKKLKVHKEPPHVRLSAPFGGEAEGLEGTAPWEAESITLSSSDLLFATSAGNTECALEVPVGVAQNTSRFNGVLVGETPGSLSCGGTIGSEPTELVTQVWSMRFEPSGAVTACTNRRYASIFDCSAFNASGVVLDIGSVGCEYLHSTKRTAAMTGSFNPAALDSAEPNTVEVTLPAQKFQLAREQRKAPAFSSCPKEGQLSGHFAAQTEHDGPVQARVVDAQQLLVNPPRPCSVFYGLHEHCTIQWTNFNRTEAVELREVVVIQGEAPKEEEVLRVPMAGECAGSVETAHPTILDPGQSCSVVVENAMKVFQTVNVLVTTTSQPGGAPSRVYVAVA
jgi:hypothetical protein